MNGASDRLIPTILAAYPETQAVYLFGSYDTTDEWPISDVDIAVLLPHALAKQARSMAMSELRVALESVLKKEVDLINLRQASTVFQKEVIMADRRIFCADLYAADEFEMLVLSFYQELNEQRREILGAFYKTRRAYSV